MSPRRASKWLSLVCGTALLGAGTLVLIAGAEPPAPTEPQKPAAQATQPPATEAKPREKIEPKPIGDAVKKGLEYLVQQQHENGGWGQGGGWRTGSEGQGGRDQR